MKSILVLAILAASLPGCAMTQEDQQAFTDALRSHNDDVADQRRRQSAPRTPISCSSVVRPGARIDTDCI
jgi:hypothetical protein